MNRTHTALSRKSPSGLYQAPVWVSIISEILKKKRVTEKTIKVVFKCERVRKARYRSHVAIAIQIAASITLNQK
jgi:hypothetical protein